MRYIVIMRAADGYDVVSWDMPENKIDSYIRGCDPALILDRVESV